MDKQATRLNEHPLPMKAFMIDTLHLFTGMKVYFYFLFLFSQLILKCSGCRKNNNDKILECVCTQHYHYMCCEKKKKKSNKDTEECGKL